MKLSKQSFTVMMFSVFALILSLVGMPSTTSAYIGEQIIDAPQPGWSRYDDTNGNINYEGGFFTESYNMPFGGSYSNIEMVGDKIKFNFTGSNLKLLATYDYNFYDYTNNGIVYVDGQQYPFIQNDYPGMNQIVFFELLGLEDKEHFVEIVVEDNFGINSRVSLDAIDIDEGGTLLPFNENVMGTTDLTLDLETEKTEVFSTEVFTVDVWLKNGQDIYAEDLNITYDDTLFEFVGASAGEGLDFYHSEEDEGSALRYILASQGRDFGINEDAVLVTLTFKAKFSGGFGKIVVENGLVADKYGNEYAPSLTELEINVTLADGDVNNDGKVTLGDLAIASYDTGVSSEEVSEVESDVNLDGEINDTDLSVIVQAILDAENGN
ncbi:cohesin domain-containing protein [Bacillus sp. SM2101]|uniref:cohesin domain-containing protein n=1 Tax=Bacillus sp. SM2101 TaxID=2805366 RepID=UPI001BDF52CA|nr:cohesin domain-containing protein [Bacillus sp. SM2101]